MKHIGDNREVFAHTPIWLGLAVAYDSLPDVTRLLATAVTITSRVVKQGKEGEALSVCPHLTNFKRMKTVASTNFATTSSVVWTTDTVAYALMESTPKERVFWSPHVRESSGTP
jgi:hypothetical protein